MSRDKGLEELLREHLADLEGVSEKAMFGGWAWLLDGHLLCGARDDGVLVRLGKGNDRAALKLEGVVPMVSRGREMAGWIRVQPETFADTDLAEKLLSDAVRFVRSLPAKR
jgi:TfoX/Sxy family transcriptional regulator of competence genes